MRRLIVLLTLLAAGLVAVPAAQAHRDKPSHHHWGWGNGETTLDVDPGTLAALTSLGVAPGAVDPASLDGAQYSFPITNPLKDALRSGVVKHKGGISLTAGDTTVELTNFKVDLIGRQLFGKVNGAGPVALLDLDFSRLDIQFDRGRIHIGPVGTTLTQGAADALNGAFGVSALTDDTVLGDVTINYRTGGGWHRHH